MVRVCPTCGYHWSWVLNDGRFKCRRCGKKYAFKSIWDSFRLPKKTKRLLLEYFVLDVSAYRLRFRGPASRPTIERFFRQIRTVLSIAEGCYQPLMRLAAYPAHVTRGKYHEESAKDEFKMILLQIRQENGIVRAIPDFEDDASLGYAAPTHPIYSGRLSFTEDGNGRIFLPLHGQRIVLRKTVKQITKNIRFNIIENFWSYLKQWLHHYRSIPQKFFHLFLGEILFRFNHRHEDLYPLIIKLLQRTAGIQKGNNESGLLIKAEWTSAD